MKKSLLDLLDLSDPIDIVDIGANDIDGEPVYKKLLDLNIAKVIGFEPNSEALTRLNDKKGPNEKYIGKAVFNGSQHELKICVAEGMTSLLEPNLNLLNYLHLFPRFGKVNDRQKIQTVRLDDVKEIKNIDYLKIDIQGGELEVFKNSPNFLSECSVIHTEVEFLPMYKNQPLFSEVEMFLREKGFIFHRFYSLVSRTIQPLLVNNNPYADLSQVTWADAVFVKDFTKFNKLSILQLKKTALILHYIYGSFDLAMRALIILDKKLKTTIKFADKYLEYLRVNN